MLWCSTGFAHSTYGLLCAKQVSFILIQLPPQPFSDNQVDIMYKSAMTGRLQPRHKALCNRPPQHRPVHKKPKHRRGPASSTSTQPQTVLPLRSQILRVAEEQEENEQHPETDTFPEEEDELAIPPTSDVQGPATPPFPPPMQPTSSNTTEILDLIRQFHTAFLESHDKMERLVQQATTMLTTQHEATTAILASCKQQLDILESLMRQNSPDWS